MQKRVVMRLQPATRSREGCGTSAGQEESGCRKSRKRFTAHLKPHCNVFYDEKGAVGRRYRRQDEAGTPFCITVDSQSLQDRTVTIRDRDTLQQWRVQIDECVEEVRQRIS